MALHRQRRCISTNVSKGKTSRLKKRDSEFVQSIASQITSRAQSTFGQSLLSHATVMMSSSQAPTLRDVPALFVRHGLKSLGTSLGLSGGTNNSDQSSGTELSSMQGQPQSNCGHSDFQYSLGQHPPSSGYPYGQVPPLPHCYGSQYVSNQPPMAYGSPSSQQTHSLSHPPHWPPGRVG